jgi:hypothetical protein
MAMTHGFWALNAISAAARSTLSAFMQALSSIARSTRSPILQALSTIARRKPSASLIALSVDYVEINTELALVLKTIIGNFIGNSNFWFVFIHCDDTLPIVLRNRCAIFSNFENFELTQFLDFEPATQGSGSCFDKASAGNLTTRSQHLKDAAASRILSTLLKATPKLTGRKASTRLIAASALTHRIQSTPLIAPSANTRRTLSAFLVASSLTCARGGTSALLLTPFWEIIRNADGTQSALL